MEREPLPPKPSKAKPCRRPPPGWKCSRGADHDGPCAARKAKPKPCLPWEDAIALLLQIA